MDYMKKIVIKAVLGWFLLAMMATINGIARNALYKPVVGDLLAHQISTIILIIVFFVVTYLLFRRDFALINGKVWLGVGFSWLVATEAFEFLVGHYVFGNSWEKLLADYNLFAGRLWILVILAIFIAPYTLSKIKKT